MSQLTFNKKLFYVVSSFAFYLLSTQTQALPDVPPEGVPRPPIHVVPNDQLLAPNGMSPAQIKQAYSLPLDNQGLGSTIAIVDSGDDPNIEADLTTFSNQYGLPVCTTANGCFTKLYSDGAKPAADPSWAVEISLDVEWAHAIAPQAKIILIETQDASSLYNGAAFAIKQKPTVISLSWGSPEFSSELAFDAIFKSSQVPIVAATGDSGNGVWYPSVSPYVVAAGGTQLNVDANGNYLSEIAWSGSGGGLSNFEVEPTFQKLFVIAQPKGMRGVPDVAWNASGNTPYAVYDSFQQSGWIRVYGTSASAPQWAGVIAIMESSKHGGFRNFNGSIYSVARETTPMLLHDILNGGNGACTYYCAARSGYDYVTGLGSPQATLLVNRFR
jgi:subtilase family serine protease